MRRCLFPWLLLILFVGLTAACAPKTAVNSSVSTKGIDSNWAATTGNDPIAVDFTVSGKITWKFLSGGACQANIVFIPNAKDQTLNPTSPDIFHATGSVAINPQAGDPACSTYNGYYGWGVGWVDSMILCQSDSDGFQILTGPLGSCNEFK